MADLLTHIKALNAKTQAWVDAGPGRFAGMMVEDLEHWNEYAIYTPAQFDRYMDECAYSELYKSIMGFRPRNMGSMSDTELKDALERLDAEADAMIESEQEQDAHITQLDAEDARMAPLENAEPMAWEEEDLRYG